MHQWRCFEDTGIIFGSCSPDQFDIVTNFPRRTLPCKPSPEHPSPPSLKEAGFGKSEMLFVSDLDS